MAHNAEQLITGFAKVCMIHGIEYLEYIQENELISLLLSLHHFTKTVGIIYC